MYEECKKLADRAVSLLGKDMDAAEKICDTLTDRLDREMDPFFLQWIDRLVTYQELEPLRKRAKTKDYDLVLLQKAEYEGLALEEMERLQKILGTSECVPVSYCCRPIHPYSRNRVVVGFMRPEVSASSDPERISQAIREIVNGCGIDHLVDGTAGYGEKDRRNVYGYGNLLFYVETV